jgi:type IX secretion system PorP/SprF family membrane protein
MRSLQKIKLSYLMISTVLIIIGGQHARAQLTSFHSMYFENEYLANPAMAGLQKGLNIDLGYQQQWTNVPGAPKLQNVTADYNSGNNVGLGINVNADQAGLINRTRAMVTYAYHLPINSNSKLNFGLSLGINDTYIDYSKIVGDAGDIQAANYNNQKVYVDGDFGISYTTNKLTVQGAIPNLKSVFFQKDGEDLDVDRSTFFTAASYKFISDNRYNNITVEPKVAFRGIKGFDNILDAGLNVDLTNYNFNLSGIYHTNKTITFGVGFSLPATDLLFAYTNNTGPLRSYANNTFEFGVRLKLFR